jgi:hypothetical protein
MILTTLLLAAVSFTQDARYNFAADANFSNSKTYKWAECKGAQQLNQIADQQLKTAVDAELAKDNLAKTENDNADLFFCYQVALGDEK